MDLFKEFLLSPDDVFEKTPLDNSGILKMVCNCLIDEYELICNCLGSEFYAKLKKDVYRPENVKEYCPGEHEEGDIIFYQGYYYERILCDEDEEPEEDEEEIDSTMLAMLEKTPDCSKCWERKGKFKKKCYNKIWEPLRTWLAWEIYGNVLPFVHIKPGATGFMVPGKEEGQEGTSKAWYDTYIRSVRITCAKKLKTLKNYIKVLCETGECPELNEVLFMKALCGPEKCDPEDKCQTGTAWKR